MVTRKKDSLNNWLWRYFGGTTPCSCHNTKLRWLTRFTFKYICPPNYGESAGAPSKLSPIFKNLGSNNFKVLFISLTRRWAINVLIGKDFYVWDEHVAFSLIFFESQLLKRIVLQWPRSYSYFCTTLFMAISVNYQLSSWVVSLTRSCFKYLSFKVFGHFLWANAYFERHMTQLVVKNVHPKYTCYNEIRLCDQMGEPKSFNGWYD